MKYRRAGGVDLPAPLPPSEAARIRRAFAQQRAGDLAAAEREAMLLDADLRVGGLPLGLAMQGYLLADRHLGPFTRPGADVLAAWLERWSDLADAPAVHALLMSRLPRGAARPPAPIVVMLSADIPPPPATAPVPEETEPVGDLPARNQALDRDVRDTARTGRADLVERLLGRTRGLSPAYAALLRGEAARSLFAQNRDADAYAIAAGAAENAALAGYAAGLAAWRLHRPEQAMAAFEAGWRANLSTSSLRAATAFWAARAHLRARDPAGYVPWLQRAAAERRTFYGMLARRILGLDSGLAPGGRDSRDLLTEADVDAIAATPEGLHAFALLQVGQTSRAEAELRRLWPAAQGTPALGRALMLVAEKAGLIELAGQLADLVQTADGRPREAVRFPVPRLRPDGGFRIDPALIYGIARTESDFDANLVSPAGATGLMQIMPETAADLTGTRAGQARLRDPAANLALGQRYVDYLAGQDGINGDLLRVLASYNAGPGGVARWTASIRDDGDPLLFIEAVPIEETRSFIPRVLAYTWIYASRLHLPTPSLDELAAGNWPRYHALDIPPERLARLN